MSILLNGHSVSFRYDPISPGSFVSVSAVVNLGLLHNWRNSYSVIISVPALPSTFTSSIEVSLDPSLDCDLVLGMNWIGLCRVAMSDGMVEFDPMSPECGRKLIKIIESH